MNYKLLLKEEESIAKQIVDAAFIIHKNLGPSLLEKVYEVCFCHEICERALKYQRQVAIPIIKTESKESNYNLSALVPLWQKGTKHVRYCWSRLFEFK